LIILSFQNAAYHIETISEKPELGDEEHEDGEKDRAGGDKIYLLLG